MTVIRNAGLQISNDRFGLIELLTHTPHIIRMWESMNKLAERASRRDATYT